MEQTAPVQPEQDPWTRALATEHLQPVAVFALWLRNARAGEQCVYWRGFLAMQRGVPELADIARQAWVAHEARLVCLVQKRIAAGDYQYIAIRKGPRNEHAATRAKSARRSDRA